MDLTTGAEGRPLPAHSVQQDSEGAEIATIPLQRRARVRVSRVSAWCVERLRRRCTALHAPLRDTTRRTGSAAPRDPRAVTAPDTPPPRRSPLQGCGAAALQPTRGG